MNFVQQTAVPQLEENQEHGSGTQIPAKILVVDDESDLEILFRQMFRREIRKHEMAFSFVHNGQQALDKLESEQFDMVLSDIRMPHMDGLTLLSRLNKTYPMLKAVMVTAYGDMENIRKAMNGGAFDFISKPIQYHDLKATIEKTLNHVKELQELQRAREEKVEAQARLVEELRKLDKLKDEFLANTSHELRTPLNGIIGIVESLLQNAKEPGVAENLNLVLQSGKRLAHLVNEILDFSKLRNEHFALKRQVLSITPIVANVLGLSEPLALAKGLSLVNEVGAGLPDVNGDDFRLQQIIHNLVGNAIKFTSQGSVTVRAAVDEDFLRISVTDTGMGIAPEKHGEIFEAFLQGDGDATRSFDGTGLGLSITRHLVAMHGGEIELVSDIGQGATFSFTLPIAGTDKVPASDSVQAIRALNTFEDQAQNRLTKRTETLEHAEVTSSFRAPHMPAAPSRPRDGRLGIGEKPADHHIMVVDDNPINVQVLVNHLHEYRVSRASNGQEALSLMEREHFDLILLDVMMPGLSGYEVCARIRQTYSTNELPVLLITAKNQTKDLVMGLESGANDYITKPFAMKELLARVKTHLQLALLTKNLKNAQAIALENARAAGKAGFCDIGTTQCGQHTEQHQSVLYPVCPKIKPVKGVRFVHGHGNVGAEFRPHWRFSHP